MQTIPTRIGNFEVIRQIGSGGMGAVYLGRDPELNRQVAIKVIREVVHDQEVLDRFFREARAAAALRHPNIITIYASGQHEQKPYMAMEFVDGESLADIIKSRRTLNIDTKLSYLEQLCSGLHFAHRAGIVHRDVKPANVMVDRDGMVRILDFGIARVEGSAMTQDGALIGSLNYLSPEQMLGRAIDQRSDIFSLGSVAYELLSGQQAFKGGLNDGLLQRLPYENPAALSDICPGLPAGLEGVILRALQKAPEDRFQDLAEMRAAVVEIQRRLGDADDQRTVMLPRGGIPAAPPPVPGTPIDVPTPLSTVAPLAPAPSAGVSAIQPPPAMAPQVAFPAGPGTGGAGTGGSTITTGAPPSAAQTWQVKKKTEAAPAARREAAAVKRPPAPAAPPPVPAARASSRTWILLGTGALAIAIGAVVALPWITAAPPSALEREQPAIEAAMERFRVGYRNRDLPAVTAAFPSLPGNLRQTMQKTFTSCLVYEVVFDDMSIAIPPGDDSAAEVAVRSTHTCTPQSGGRQTTTSRDEVFSLTKDGDGWTISSVAAGAARSADRP